MKAEVETSLSRKPKAPSVDARLVERLADLARLSFTPEEAERLKGELSSILEYFATLDKVDVSKVPLPEGSGKGEGLREDAVGPSIPEKVLRGVPQKRGRYVRAPRVF